MIFQKTYHTHALPGIYLRQKLSDYGQLVKFRLTVMVIFSTFAGFLLGSGLQVDWFQLIMILVGGFMIVGAANGINQIIERDADKKMRRTENRPLAQNRLAVWEAAVFCIILGLSGVLLLGFVHNPLTGWLSFASLVLYAFVYTPLKKHSPIAVFVGAIPGALPPAIGYAGATGSIDGIAISLFLIQFIWQFPHFWAIAWVLQEDYQRAGYNLLPLGGEKNRRGAFQIVMFSMLIIPVSILPAVLGIGGVVSAIAGLAGGIYLLARSMVLFRRLDDPSARKLMYASFIYIPAVFLIFILDRFFIV
ncbi:MAG: heme o synthase [Bacteroidia bacterium]